MISSPSTDKLCSIDLKPSPSSTVWPPLIMKPTPKLEAGHNLLQSNLLDIAFISMQNLLCLIYLLIIIIVFISLWVTGIFQEFKLIATPPNPRYQSLEDRAQEIIPEHWSTIIDSLLVTWFIRIFNELLLTGILQNPWCSFWTLFNNPWKIQRHIELLYLLVYNVHGFEADGYKKEFMSCDSFWDHYKTCKLFACLLGSQKEFNDISKNSCSISSCLKSFNKRDIVSDPSKIMAKPHGNLT